MTSSYAAVGYTVKPDNHYSEADWTDPDTEGLPAYHKSKVPAERAARDAPRRLRAERPALEMFRQPLDAIEPPQGAAAATRAVRA
jgi:hypothetical protein